MFADIGFYQIPDGARFPFVTGDKVEAEIAAANLVPVPEEPRELFLLIDWPNADSRVYESRAALIDALNELAHEYDDATDMREDYKIYRLADNKPVRLNITSVLTISLN